MHRSHRAGPTAALRAPRTPLSSLVTARACRGSYALVTSWHPLVVYLHSGGLARFATRPYTLDPSSAADRSVHLTNATCNPTARRKMLPELRARLAAPDLLGPQRAAALWGRVDDLVVKTMLAVEGTMSAALEGCSLDAAAGRPNACCFQLFGLDVLVGADGAPWLPAPRTLPAELLSPCVSVRSAHR